MALDVTKSNLFEINQVLAGSGVVDCVPSHRLEAGAQHTILPVASCMYGKMAYVNFAEPTAGFDTHQLKTLLDIINDGGSSGTFGVSGDVMTTGRVFGTEDPTPKSLHLYYAKRDNFGAFASGSVHGKATMIQGAIALQQLAAAQDAMAVASLLAHATWDGTNDPVAIVQNAALPDAAAGDVCFTLGPCYIATAEIALVQGWTYTPGFTLRKLRAAGAPYPQYGFVGRGPGPTFAVALERPTTFFDLGITNLKSAVVAATLYLQRCKTYGVREGVAETVHIKLVIPRAILRAGGSAAGQLDNAMVDQLILTVLDDGTNPPMTWSYDVAITVPS